MESRKDAGKKIGLISAEFENSKNKFVQPIALKLGERWLEAVQPAFDEFDSPLAPPLGQTECRGRLYYLDGSVDVLLYLVEEGGRRSVRVSMCKLTPRQCRIIEEAARRAWVEGAHPRYVEKLLESLDLTVITQP
jgi:hypothetical protein